MPITSFFKNPFEHDFGKLIKTKRYDYIYQPNTPASKPRESQCLQGKPRHEANTGFYYFSHESETYKTIIERTLKRCKRQRNKLDDQKLFWQELWKVKKKLEGSLKSSNSSDVAASTSSNYTAVFQHCQLADYEDSTIVPNYQTNGKKYSSFQYCCIDPYYYPIGKHDERRGPPNRDPVTYHANFGSKYEKKVKKLEFARRDGYGWNKSRFKDGKGGILVEEYDGKNK